MNDLLLQFAVDHPFFLLLIFPLVAITGYLYGLNKQTPIYEITPYIIEIEPPLPEEEIVSEQEVVDSILETALVQELPPETGLISIVPVTRIQMNRWIKKEEAETSDML